MLTRGSGCEPGHLGLGLCWEPEPRGPDSCFSPDSGFQRLSPTPGGEGALLAGCLHQASAVGRPAGFPGRLVQRSLPVPEGFFWPRVGLSPSLTSQISEAKAAQAFPAARRARPAQLQCSSGGTSRRLPPLAGLERCRLSANAVCGHLLPPPPTASWQRLQLPSEQPALCISPPPPRARPKLPPALPGSFAGP